MELRDQVTSLKLSKKLKKLGVKQDSLFWWKHHWVGNIDNITDVDEWNIEFGKSKECKYKNWGISFCSAFTVAELIKLLGKKFGVLERFPGRTYGAYIPNNCGVNGMGKTPQEALANLLINTNED